MRHAAWRWVCDRAPIAQAVDRAIGRRNPFDPRRHPWRHGVYRRSMAVWLAYLTFGVVACAVGAKAAHSTKVLI